MVSDGDNGTISGCFQFSFNYGYNYGLVHKTLFKATVSREICPRFISNQEPLLVPFEVPWKNFDFHIIFAEIVAFEVDFPVRIQLVLVGKDTK